MELEEVKKRVDENAQKIIQNMERIHNNEANIQKNSLALEILKDYKRSTKRLYFVLILIIILWAVTLFIFHL